ncbi:hypothetical protein C414_000420033 [Campylobacter jejuni subsp. jejuni 414]|nr:hypothetical protein C414_000420033 [Campylobacter jejuni subsp. jejuni 414]
MEAKIKMELKYLNNKTWENLIFSSKKYHFLILKNAFNYIIS